MAPADGHAFTDDGEGWNTCAVCGYSREEHLTPTQIAMREADKNEGEGRT